MRSTIASKPPARPKPDSGPAACAASRGSAAGDVDERAGHGLQRDPRDLEWASRNLQWEYSTSLISAERGNLDNKFIEITEDEANQIVERIRAKVTGASSGQ
jgi:hypothetical protein